MSNPIPCNEAEHLMHAYLDSELELTKSLEFEKHLQGCDRCSRAYKNLEVLQSSIRKGSFYYEKPKGLEKKIRNAFMKEESRGTRWFIRPLQWAPLAASFVLLFLFWKVIPPAFGPSSEARLSEEILSDHIRSLMPNHLIDVASTNQHTVKPWFNGKLDFSPQVKDLSSQGFNLIGGRLDYVNKRSVAALVYHLRGHAINVFVWPLAKNTPEESKMETDRGYHLIHWNANGMTYWVASDLNEAELQEFVKLFQSP